MYILHYYQVNLSFDRLRRHVPTLPESKNNNRKLSKVDTLRSAADYIQYLKNLLDSADLYLAASTASSPPSYTTVGPLEGDGSTASPPSFDVSPLHSVFPVITVQNPAESDSEAPTDVSWIAAVQAAAIQSARELHEFSRLSSVSLPAVLPPYLSPFQQQPSPTVSQSSDGNSDGGWSQSPSYYSYSGRQSPEESEMGVNTIDNNYEGTDFLVSDESVRQCLLELTAWLMQ